MGIRSNMARMGEVPPIIRTKLEEIATGVRSIEAAGGLTVRDREETEAKLHQSGYTLGDLPQDVIWMLRNAKSESRKPPAAVYWLVATATLVFVAWFIYTLFDLTG